MTTPQAALAALQSVPPGNTSALLNAASEALQHGHAAAAEPILAAAAAAASGSPQLWQFLGLARRELQDSAGAHTAFTRAASMIPDDPLIAHSQARTALEAGYPAVPLFNRARLLAPTEASVVLGRAAALFANGEGEAACDQLAHLLASSPGWSEGHLAYARLSAQVRPAQPIDATLRAALKLHPASGGLWQLVFRVWTEARDYTRALAAVEQARAALGRDPELDRLEAICLTELGEADAAQALFDQLPFPADGEAATWPIRNYLRLGRYDEARLLAEQDFGNQEASLWPYRALIWRLLDDPRWDWLEGDERLIRTYDIAAGLGPLDGLADVLRNLHAAKAQPLDQSVRGGTQTDGNLLARAEPEIRRLRAALLEAVRSYVDQLPPPDSAHPMLRAQRDDLQVAGSWSVRLTDKGFHADHVHCQGWISSACYVVVPETAPTAAPEAGWLAFGECRDVLPDLVAFRTVEPIPGKLALFPSILWHGTRPFDSGERMTVAFDIARPAQA